MAFAFYHNFTIKRINKGLKRKNERVYFIDDFTIKRINKGLKLRTDWGL